MRLRKNRLGFRKSFKSYIKTLIRNIRQKKKSMKELKKLTRL